MQTPWIGAEAFLLVKDFGAQTATNKKMSSHSQSEWSMTKLETDFTEMNWSSWQAALGIT